MMAVVEAFNEVDKIQYILYLKSSKMKNVDQDHKSKVVYLLKMNDFVFMVWVKIFYF